MCGAWATNVLKGSARSQGRARIETKVVPRVNAAAVVAPARKGWRRFGRGFGMVNASQMRKLYLCRPHRNEFFRCHLKNRFFRKKMRDQPLKRGKWVVID